MREVVGLQQRRAARVGHAAGRPSRATRAAARGRRPGRGRRRSRPRARRPRTSRARPSAARPPGPARASPSPRPSARTASAIAACAHLAAEPCSPWALDAARADVREELRGRRGRRRLGPRAADVDAGVVVGAADAGAAVRVDVDRRRHVELAARASRCASPRSGTAARAGGGGAAAAAPRRRRTGAPARTRSRARGGTRRRPRRRRRAPAASSWSSGVMPKQRTCTACGSPRKRGGQLLGDEHVGPVGDLQHAVDRVVVGDRHEVHPAPLGELVDLLRRRRALRQAERALDAELRDLRRGRVAVQVRPVVAVMCPRFMLDMQRLS